MKTILFMIALTATALFSTDLFAQDRSIIGYEAQAVRMGVVENVPTSRHAAPVTCIHLPVLIPTDLSGRKNKKQDNLYKGKCPVRVKSR